MSKFVLLDARIFAGAADLSGNSSQVELSCEVEEKDTTAFGDTWKTSLGGLAATSIHGAGQWEAGDAGKVDDETWAKLNGRTVHPWTICPDGAAVGDLAWITNALRSNYKLMGAAGDVAPWDAQASGTTPLIRGTVMHEPGTARTTTGNGSGVQLGAVSSSQKLYAAWHLYSVAGTSPQIGLVVKSSVDDTFAAPTTRITFTDMSAVGGQFMSVAGPITDTWWKVNWTISGTSPSFLFIAALGIG